MNLSFVPTWENLSRILPDKRCFTSNFAGERDEFEKYYRKQRRQQASLTLQPPANMHESIDG